MLAILFHDWLDLLLICTLLGFAFHASIDQLRNSDDVVESLVWDSSRSALALRDGTISEVAMKDLVPGDIVHVSEVDRPSSYTRIMT